MQQIEEALTMLADRGEDLPIEVLITRLETELDPSVSADPVATAVGKHTPELAEPFPVRARRVVRPIIAVAFGAAVVVAVVLAATVMLARGGGEPADVPPVDTTIIEPDNYEVVHITFDGLSCTVEGPTSIAAATVVPVVLTNTSGSSVQFDLARLGRHIATGEQRTFEDFARLQRAGGGVLREDPDNLIDSPMNWLRVERNSFDPNAHRLASTLSDNQALKVYELSANTDTGLVFVSRQGAFDPETRTSPEAFWFCTPLEVTPIDF